MSFSQLPAELTHQVFEELASSPHYVTDSFSLLELRRVNRIFDEKIIAHFAKCRIRALKCRDADAMLPNFKRRLIRICIGDFDGGTSALSTYFHSVAIFIANLLQDGKMDMCPDEPVAGRQIEKCATCYGSEGHHASTNQTWELNQSVAKFWLNVICEALVAVQYDVPSFDLLWMDENFAKRILERQAASGQASIHSALSEAAFLVSICCQHTDLQDLLIRIGASPDSSCRFFGGNALRAACRAENLDTVRRLLQVGACVQPERQMNYSLGIPSYFAEVFRTDNAQILELLTESHWKSPFVTKGKAKTAARQASTGGAWACLDVLIEKWPCIIEEKDRFIFRDACKYGRDDVVLQFLQTGLDPSFRNHVAEGCPLRHAVEGGHYSTCKLLVKHGADLDIKNREALFSRSAARGGSVEILQLLMRHGLEDVSEDYAFVIAAERGHREFMEYIVSEGFHRAHRNNPSIEAVALLAAVGQGHAAVIEYLIENLKVSVNGIMRDGWPSIAIKPLDIAIDAGRSEAVRLLRSLGATPPDTTMSFSLVARKGREALLRQFKRKLELLERHTWKSFRGSQRLVDKALEVSY